MTHCEIIIYNVNIAIFQQTATYGCIETGQHEILIYLLQSNPDFVLYIQKI